MIVDFFVEGRPAPQGSKNGFSRVGTSRVQMVESSKYVKPWRAAVQSRASEIAREIGTLDGPLELSIVFYLPRGKTVKRALPTTKPDLSKLIRSTEDAIVDSGLVKDDSLFVKFGEQEKQYATGATGARIRIETINV